MKKNRFFALLFFSQFSLVLTVNSASLQSRIMGTWLLYNLKVDEKNSVATYLRLNFHGKILTISDSPFDFGVKNEISFGAENFTLWDASSHEDEIFTVENLSRDSLTLSKSTKGQEIRYFFVKDILYSKLPPCRSDTLNLDATLIVYENESTSDFDRHHLGFRSFPKYELKYLISAKANCFNPRPIFFYSRRSSFNSFFLKRFNGSRMSKIDNANNHFAYTATITKSGLSEIQTVKASSTKLESHIFDIINSSRTYWRTGNQYPLDVKFGITILFIDPTKR